MNKIKVQWRQQGQYKIMETLDFGFKLGVRSDVRAVNGYITYDPNNAYLKANENGYIYLKINDPNQQQNQYQQQTKQESYADYDNGYD